MTTDNQPMKQIANIRDSFDYRFDLLAGDENLYKNFRGWWSRFEDLLVETFEAVFEENKKVLARDPVRLARETLISWCLAADVSGGILCEVENHYDWRDVLKDLEDVARSEIPAEDLAYSPVPKLCLAMLSMLPPRSRWLRKTLSQMHPALTSAINTILVGEGCGTVEEVVDALPVLKGISDDELKKLRGNRGISVGTAARELLCARLRSSEQSTVDRYFRPKEFLFR